MCVCVFLRSMCLKKLFLRDDFKSLICWLDHWLSCILDCIHVCVFLLLRNCFEKLAQHILDTSSIASYLSSFLSFFLSQSRQHLDTWWIDWASSCLLDSFLTPGGSIELLFLIRYFCSSIPSRHLHLSMSIFSTPTSTDGSTHLDTLSVEIYWGSI